MLIEFLDKVHSSKRGIFLSPTRFLLYIVSLFYGLVMHVRNSLFDSYQKWGPSFALQLLKVGVYQSDAKVISIGNIVAGGTGKTPLTLFIAKKLLEHQRSVAILSRGYKAKMEKAKNGPELVSNGKGPIKNPQECGDEPYLMSKNLPEALFYVGKNRVNSAKLAVAAGANTLLLDDGMQHRALHRDYDIVILDAQDPFGMNHFLPRGFLREHPNALKRASLIVVNHASSKERFEKIKEMVTRWTNAPIVGVSPQYLKTISLDEQKAFEIQGKKVIAFCGIAKPKYFFDMLEKQGVELLSKEILPDHQLARASFLNKLSIKANDLKADLILCTEKDAVKINLEKDFITPIGYVKMELIPTYCKEEFENAIIQMM